MEILYTEITQDLTSGLLKEALTELSAGRKVYYIVPSSMSFEKEKEILERLNAGADTAVFDLLVTRFKQLPYYFDRREGNAEKTELSLSGLSMLFRRVMMSFSKEELPLYYALQHSSGFLELLIQLRQELLAGNLSAEDLPDSPKNRELKKILGRFEEELAEGYANYSEFGTFIDRINEGDFDAPLKESVLILDGYTRFSAEEELFISVVQSRVSRLIIGTYAEKNALTDLSETVYTNAVEMIQRFRGKFDVQLRGLLTESVNEVYDKLTELVSQDFRFALAEPPIQLSSEDQEHFTIWEAENQNVEIERVAKEIRQKVAQGARFKEFTVLVGDPTAYEATLKEIFELYEIPLFYAQEESMSQHPLIIFFESLYAIKKNNYRTNDVINLLKSGVYSSVNSTQNVLDQFEYYVQQFKISGRKKFTERFTEEAFLHLDEVEQLREELLGSTSALQVFLGSNALRTGEKWVSALQELLEEGGVVRAINDAYLFAEEKGSHQVADRHEQVWKTLLSTLTEFTAVFTTQKMKVLEFLDILLSGLKNANYRQVPANVDVVNVKDYELVEPQTNQYIYAIGLSQTNFPRFKKNSTLLSDEERQQINAVTEEHQFIEQLNVVNYHKNIFTVLSLINAAKERLVLSTPQILANEQGELSPFFQLFIDHSEKGIKQEIRGANLSETLEHVGNSRAVIALIGKIERDLLESTGEKASDQRTFWSSLFRILTKNHPDFQKMLLQLERDIDTVALSEQTLQALYGDKIYASVSSFERFYNCEYQYFLERTLDLENFETIDINSKIVGNFFHEVFEKMMTLTGGSAEHFDEQLTAVLHEVDSNYARYFTQDALARFTWSNLEEIARQTAVMLKKTLEAGQLKTLMTESSFGLPQSELGNFSIDGVELRGRIDRVDQLFAQHLGAVDYKSSSHSFNLQEAYDGLSLQFLTYLDVLKTAFPEQKLWGALYLQFKNQAINLSELNTLSEIDQKLTQSMRYEGLLLSEVAQEFKTMDSIAVKPNNVFSQADFEQLLARNEDHYRVAGQRLKEGKIAINPVMKRSEGLDHSGNVRGCRYCPLKAICRFEANVHMNNHTREIGKKSVKTIKEELKGTK